MLEGWGGRAAGWIKGENWGILKWFKKIQVRCGNKTRNNTGFCVLFKCKPP